MRNKSRTTEKNNRKAPVDFTSENDSAQGMLCFII